MLPQSPTNDIHCADNAGDRAIGKRWENNFCVLASRYGKVFTAHQIYREKSAHAITYHTRQYHRLLLPDVTVWSAPGEHHEIKHKRSTDQGFYGLEHYRLKALKWFADETQQGVYYTIHDWGKLGDRLSPKNNPADWRTANINRLWDATADGTAIKAQFDSYVGGLTKRVSGWYWPSVLWGPLISLWES